jgi:hypothetical protein
MIHPVKHLSLYFIVALALGGCAAPLEGPSVMALPGTGRGFDQFRVGDSACRAYAFDQVGGRTVSGTATETAVASAAVGTAVGAAIGAAANGSQGAGTGAAIGLGLGTLTGAGLGADAGYGVQRRYDNAYVQCMYAKGNRVPVSGDFAQASAPSWTEPAPSPSRYRPPPPPGLPPPPPPGTY